MSAAASLGEQVTLPLTMEGHWETSGGHEMATEYVSKKRGDLCRGEMSDLNVANAVFMADRFDLDLIVWQQAAKERIRWLSAQLAAAQTELAEVRGEA